MGDGMRTDCVVDFHCGEFVIWHVNTGPEVGLSRLTGAWVLDVRSQETIGLLTRERRVLATPEAEQALSDIDIKIPEHIDRKATFCNLEVERDALQDMFDTHPNRKNLVEPDWPSLPTPPTPGKTPSPDSERTGVALALAQWLVQVAVTWELIESQRLLRNWMPGGRNRRTTPIAVRANII